MPTGPGRPAIGGTLKVAIPDDLRERLDAYAEAEGMKLAEVIRQALDEWLPGGKRS